MDNPAQGHSCLDCGYSKPVLSCYHPGYLSTTLVVAAPSYQFHHSLERGLCYDLFFLKSVYFREMKLRTGRQRLKTGKPKILKGYCLQCSQRKTGGHRKGKNRNYFVCLRQNKPCATPIRAIAINIPHTSGKLLCNT